jgi:hypothetical protein
MSAANNFASKNTSIVFAGRLLTRICSSFMGSPEKYVNVPCVASAESPLIELMIALSRFISFSG